MTLEEVSKILDAEVVAGSDLAEIEVHMGCGADLMSDVLAFSRTGALLLTGLTNPQVVRTSEMADIVAVCFVRGKMPPTPGKGTRLEILFFTNGDKNETGQAGRDTRAGGANGPPQPGQ